VQRFYKSVIVQFFGDLSNQCWVIGRMDDRQCLPGKLDCGMLLPCDMVGNGQGPEGESMTEATRLASLGCQHNRFGHLLSRGGRLGGQDPGQTRRGLGPVWTPRCLHGPR
jgi:hypothetical protein